MAMGIHVAVPGHNCHKQTSGWLQVNNCNLIFHNQPINMQREIGCIKCTSPFWDWAQTLTQACPPPTPSHKHTHTDIYTHTLKNIHTATNKRLVHRIQVGKQNSEHTWMQVCTLWRFSPAQVITPLRCTLAEQHTSSVTGLMIPKAVLVCERAGILPGGAPPTQ